MKILRLANTLPPWVVGGFVFCICFFSIYPVHRLGLCTGDLAEYLNNPVRILQGELPYRDFWLLFSPLEVYLPAWLYALGGVDISHILTANLTVNALAALAAFGVARQLVDRNTYAALAGLLIFYLGPPRFTPCFVYPQHCLLFSLLGASALIYHFRTNLRVAALGAGLMFGLGMNWNLLMGAVPLFAAIITMFLRLHRNSRSKEGLASLTLLVVGAAVPLSLMALLLHEILPEAARALTVGTLTHGKSMPVPWFRDLQHCWGMAERALHTLVTSKNPIPLAVDGAHLLSIAAAYALPLTMGVVLAYHWPSDWLSQRRDSVVLLALWAALALPKFAARSGMGNLGYALCPLFILLVTMLLMPRTKPSGSRGSRAGRLVLPLLAGALSLSVLIVWAQTGREMMRDHYPVTTPRGQLWLSDASEARTWQDVFDLITSFSEDDDYMFVTMWESPPLYALTGRRNPTHFDSIIDVMALSTKEKQTGIIKDLRARPTAILVHDPEFCFDQRPDLVFSRSCPLLQRALAEQFRLVMCTNALQVAVGKAANVVGGRVREKLN